MMKKKILTILCVALLLAASALALAACDETEYSVIKFDAQGGTAIQQILAKEGEKIIAPADPTRSGYEFVGWALSADGERVDFPENMPKGETTYFALWKAETPAQPDNKVAYRIEYHLENFDGDDFPIDNERTIFAEGESGQSVSVTAPIIEYMQFDENRSTPLTMTLGEGDNVFRLYYARTIYRLLLSEGDSNPGETELNAKFEHTVALPDADYESNGKLFIGWADNENAAREDILLPGEEIELTQNKLLYAQYGTAYDGMFDSLGQVALSAPDADGNCIALYIAPDGTREWGEASGDAKGCRIQTQNFKGIFGASKLFRKDETGKYIGYSLLNDACDEKYGTLELDAAEMTAVYTVGDSVKSGSYSFLTDSDGYTGEMLLTSGSDRVNFRFADGQFEGDFVGSFIVKGEEAGRYKVMSDITSLSVEDLYEVELDGYGRLSFPISMLGLALAYGEYKGLDAAKGIWQFKFVGFIIEDISDTIYMSGGYRDCNFILKTAVKSIFGSQVDSYPVFIRELPDTKGDYTSEDGSTLSLDGFGQGTLSADDNAQEGFYMAEGSVVKFSSAGNMRYFDIDADKSSFKEVDASAGSYQLGDFEVWLSGIYPAQKTGSMRVSHGGRLIAEGAYWQTVEGDFEFDPVWVDFLYPMINGIAVGKFNFKIEEGDILMRNDALYGDFEFTDGSILSFDGYGNATLEGRTVKVGTRISNTVLLDGQGYVLNPGARSVEKASGLSGEYFTAVDEYIGPGKLAFDGNGVALFYNMTKGVLCGQGSYTYDEASGVGEFIPEPNEEFPVEGFRFILTSAYDQYGLYYENVYFKYHDESHIKKDIDGGSSFELSGYGYMTDNYSDPASGVYELTFFGEGATYDNDKKNLHLTGGSYIIHFVNVQAQAVDGMLQYRIPLNPDMTIQLTFGNTVIGVTVKDGKAEEASAETGTYYGYSYESNLSNPEMRITLDGAGKATYVSTHAGYLGTIEFSAETVSGTYTVNGEVITFVPNDGAFVMGMAQLVFKLVTFETDSGTVTLFHVSDVNGREMSLEGSDGSKLEVNGFGDVVYTPAGGEPLKADCLQANTFVEKVEIVPGVDEKDKTTTTDIKQQRLIARFDDGATRMFSYDKEKKSFEEIGIEAREYKLYDGKGGSDNGTLILLDGKGGAKLCCTIDVQNLFVTQLPIVATVASAKYEIDPDDKNTVWLSDIVVDEKYKDKYTLPKSDFGIVLGSVVGRGDNTDYVFALEEGFNKVYSTADGKTVTVNGFNNITVSGFENITSSYVITFEKRTIASKSVYVLTLRSGNGRWTYVHYFTLGEDGSTLTEILVDLAIN